LNTADGYELLYRRLTNQPRTRKPELGKLQTLAPRDRKQDFPANPCIRFNEPTVLDKLNPRIIFEQGASLKSRWEVEDNGFSLTLHSGGRTDQVRNEDTAPCVSYQPLIKSGKNFDTEVTVTPSFLGGACCRHAGLGLRIPGDHTWLRASIDHKRSLHITGAISGKEKKGEKLSGILIKLNLKSSVGEKTLFFRTT
jgi:hypothetical protein